MTMNTSQSAPPAEVWDANDEIDLRKYIDVLIKRWREIVGVTAAFVILAAGVVLAYRFFADASYAASANVAIVRTQTEVNFDERFTTSTTPNGTGAADVNSRRSALLGLVYSGAIAERVIAELGDQLSETDREPASLLRNIDAELSTQDGRTGSSDLIAITAMADTPERAAAIANAWTRNYVQEVNRIYGQVPDEMIASVQSELDAAQVTYAQAQRNLEEFVATSTINGLRRQVQETQDALAALQRTNTNALSRYLDEISNSYERIVSTYLNTQTDNQVIGFQRELQLQRRLLNAYFTAYQDAVVDSFDNERTRDTHLIRMYYDQWLRTAAALATARTLQAGLAEGGEGAVPTTATALQLLKLQFVAATTTNVPSLQTRADSTLGSADTININAPAADSADSTSALPIQNVQTIQPAPVDNGASALQPVFQVALTPPADATLASVGADLNGLISSLEQQQSALEADIADFNAQWLSGERYQNLNAGIPDESTLVNAIRAQYPELFSHGLFATIGEAAMQGSTLASDGQAQAAELLKLAGAETMLLSSQPDAPMAQSIAELDSRLKTLQAQLEAQNARNQQVVQQRDLAWESFKALSTKQAELKLERAAANSEVRLGALAVAPDRPVPGLSLTTSILLAGVVGLLVATLLAFLREYLGKPPLFTRANA